MLDRITTVAKTHRHQHPGQSEFSVAHILPIRNDSVVRKITFPIGMPTNMPPSPKA